MLAEARAGDGIVLRLVSNVCAQRVHVSLRFARLSTESRSSRWWISRRLRYIFHFGWGIETEIGRGTKCKFLWPFSLRLLKLRDPTEIFDIRWISNHDEKHNWMKILINCNLLYPPWRFINWRLNGFSINLQRNWYWWIAKDSWMKTFNDLNLRQIYIQDTKSRSIINQRIDF